MTSTTSFVGWADPALEHDLLERISLDVPWPMLEQYATLVRSSGSPEERKAFELLMAQLDAAGVPYRLYEPECWISIPQAATLRLDEPDGASFRAKTVAMSRSTGGEELTCELVYIPDIAAGDLFLAAGGVIGDTDVRGKIVLTEGLFAPGKIREIMEKGAIASIFINPGSHIHEGICTTIWGTPDLDSWPRQPAIPALAVNKADGQELIAAAQRGARVAFSTTLDTGWRSIPVLVAEIPGAQVPDEWLLLHGHVDSWHVGIGDNATGNVTMLELARVFWQQREKLARTLRIAWWSGHSHGRYAGSTWFADSFAIDMARGCVAQVNCDSPGCRWADTYNGLTAMSETEPFVEAVIPAVTGITPQPERPPRAGDYSFNGVGVSSFYMLSSTMNDDLRAEKNFYRVGGCGANIQWHTEDDTLDIADRDNLLRDMRMYAASVLRVLNAPLLPFDWRRTTAEFNRTLAKYQEAAGPDFDFGPAREAVAALETALDRMYGGMPETEEAGSAAARRFNFAQRRIARHLVRVNYSRMPEFWHDPAVHLPELPDLAPAMTMPHVRDDQHQRNILRAHLTRGQNRLVWALELSREEVEAASTI